ncbi:hypothetical protein K439DRAFT_1541020 [Ramaria rubella]|nr:hypothetical protein K439DRAFT_1541020 [Ramaria rubella]
MNQPVDSWINQTLAVHFPQQPSRAPVSTPASQDIGPGLAPSSSSATPNVTGAYPAPLASITTRTKDVSLGPAPSAPHNVTSAYPTPLASTTTLEQLWASAGYHYMQYPTRIKGLTANCPWKKYRSEESADCYLRPSNTATSGTSFQFKVPHPPPTTQGNSPPQPHYVESLTPACFQTTAPTMNMGGHSSHLVSGGSPAVNTPTLPEMQDQVQQFAHQFLLQLLQLLNSVMRDTSVAVQRPRRETRNEPTREGYLAMRNKPTRDGYVADEDEVDSDL